METKGQSKHIKFTTCMLILFIIGLFEGFMSLGLAYIRYGEISWSGMGIVDPSYFVVSGIGFAVAIVSIVLAKVWEDKIDD